VDVDVVVEVAVTQFDRPHSFYAFFGAADQKDGYEGKVEDEEEDDFSGHESLALDSPPRLWLEAVRPTGAFAVVCTEQVSAVQVGSK
jgi:hypothetical protein